VKRFPNRRWLTKYYIGLIALTLLLMITWGGTVEICAGSFLKSGLTLGRFLQSGLTTEVVLTAVWYALALGLSVVWSKHMNREYQRLRTR